MQGETCGANLFFYILLSRNNFENFPENNLKMYPIVDFERLFLFTSFKYELILSENSLSLHEDGHVPISFLSQILDLHTDIKSF